MYNAIRSGTAKQSFIHLEERDGKTAQKARKYVLDRLEKGVDWRKKVPKGLQLPEVARGLGAIEGNESNLFSDRMKDRGMSWTISGAQHMGKAIQLSFNGELAKWCGRSPQKTGTQSLSFSLFDELDSHKNVMPALTGPHASRHWVKVLRDISFPQCP